MNLIDEKICLKFKIGSILIDMIQIFPIKLSESEISFSVERDDKKTAENYRNCYVAEKRIVTKLSKISISNLDRTILELEI